MDSGSFVLSSIYKFSAYVSAVTLFRRFVLPLATLLLRNVRCIGHRALAHNQWHHSDQFSTASQLQTGTCARRYELGG